MDEKGREKQVPVYRGDYFFFDPSLAPKKERNAWAVAGCALWLLPVVLWFLMDFPGTRCLYVFLPAALGLFPAFYWILGAFFLLWAPVRMNRAQKEKGPARVLRCAAACAFFSAMASLGDLIFLFTSAPARPEWPGLLLLLCSALAALATALRFRLLLQRGLVRSGC